MTAENFDKIIRTFWKRIPFRPFIVELVSGSRIEVDHPEAFVVLRGGVGVHINQSGDWTLLDHEGVSQVFEAASQSAA